MDTDVLIDLIKDKSISSTLRICNTETGAYISVELSGEQTVIVSKQLREMNPFSNTAMLGDDVSATITYQLK